MKHTTQPTPVLVAAYRRAMLEGRTELPHHTATRDELTRRGVNVSTLTAYDPYRAFLASLEVSR